MNLYAARYCFGPIIKKDLDSVTRCWNSHQNFHYSRETIAGIPDEYSFLKISGANNMLLLFNSENIEEMDMFLDDNINFGIDDMDEPLQIHPPV